MKDKIQMEANNMEQKKQAQSSSLRRREFIKGVGISATAAFGGIAIQTDSIKGSKPTVPAGPLRDSPLVMIWRRVSSLPNSQTFANRVLQLPVLGKDPISVMFDGGGVILGFAIQEVQPSNEPVLTACSEVGLQDFFLQNNPASSIVFAPTDFKASLRNLYTDRNLITPPEKSGSGECLRFVDDDGNFSCFYRPSRSALLQRPSGTKLSSLLKSRWPASGARLVEVTFEGDAEDDAIVHNPVIGFDLLVSDLPKSQKYYTEVLGFRLLENSAEEAKFDVGGLILTLRVEPTSMLVQFLRKSGRLLGDWIVFHTGNIKETLEALRANGVAFPAGIETSVIGDVAYFNDIDGYSLALWQPSGKTKMIDFNPALKRLLNEVHAKRDSAS